MKWIRLVNEARRPVDDWDVIDRKNQKLCKMLGSKLQGIGYVNMFNTSRNATVPEQGCYITIGLQNDKGKDSIFRDVVTFVADLLNDRVLAGTEYEAMVCDPK